MVNISNNHYESFIPYNGNTIQLDTDWKTKVVDKYVIINSIIGIGKRSKICRSFLKENEMNQVAAKILPLPTLKDYTQLYIDQIKLEVKLLKENKHPNIIELQSIVRTSNYLYFFMEYCSDGNLQKYIQGKYFSMLSELEAVIYLKQIIQGLRQLISQKIVHGNLTPSKILLSKGVAKISGLRFAQNIDDDVNTAAYLYSQESIFHIPPEILAGQTLTINHDIWGLGITFYQMIYGIRPWKGETISQLLENIKGQPLQFPDRPIRSKWAKQLLSSMLQISKSNRITWDQIFSDPLLQIQHYQRIEVVDPLSEAISLNTKRYFETDLFVKYIDAVDIKFTDIYNIQMDNKIFNQEEFNTILQKDENLQQIRDSFARYYNYFVYERNIAFFLSFVIRKIVSQQENSSITLEKEHYLQLILLISKNQLLHIQRILKQLSTKEHDKFKKEIWALFQKSQQYQKLNQILVSDKQECSNFQTVVSHLFQKIKQNDNNCNIITLVNGSLEANDSFYQIYRKTVMETIEILQNQFAFTESGVKCMYLLILCANPYEQFKGVEYNFGTFFQNVEEMTEEQVLEKISKIKTNFQ